MLSLKGKILSSFFEKYKSKLGRHSSFCASYQCSYNRRGDQRSLTKVRVSFRQLFQFCVNILISYYCLFVYLRFLN
jgi:hypothetical protein